MLISNSIFRASSIELKSCQESIFKTDAGDKLDYDFHYRLPTHRLLVVLSCHMFSVLFMTLPLGMSVGETGIEIRLFLYYLLQHDNWSVNTAAPCLLLRD